MADMYWDGPTDASQDDSTEKRPKAPKRPAARGKNPAQKLPDRLFDGASEDTSAWRAALKAAGFSDAETEHLIFERLRPRQEGRTRAAE